MPGLIGRDALMRDPRSLTARRLRRVTLLVPESCAEGLRDLARVLRARKRERTAGPPFGWRRISPSAELMVDLRAGVRCAIRDTRAAGGERYHWTVTVVGMSDPIATGRTNDVASVRLQAEAALGGTRRTSASNPGRGTAPMVNEPLARLFWRALDRLDYWLTQARLWAVDAVYGPEPETAADRWRASDRERLLRAFRGWIASCHLCAASHQAHLLICHRAKGQTVLEFMCRYRDGERPLQRAAQTLAGLPLAGTTRED